METKQQPDPENDTAAAALMDTMRQALADAGIKHETDESGRYILAPFKLKNTDVDMLVCGEPGDVVIMTVTFPVRVPEDARGVVGEFILRANYGAKRGIGEMDHNDGEVRLRVYEDTIFSPFTAEHLIAVL